MSDPNAFRSAPPIDAVHWLNTPRPIALDDLRGRVVVIEAFQMLCPGCVSSGLPQASRIARLFPAEHVQVLGLHCVFEHHEAQGSLAALTAFQHEYRWPFPIAIDRPSGEGGVPHTMRSYRLQGTPSLVLIDREGRLRQNHFGHVEDMTVGAQIMALMLERPAEEAMTTLNDADSTAASSADDCGDGACRA